MNETNWGQILKVAGAIAILVMIGRACGSKEGVYSPPDPMGYDNMPEHQRDLGEYDRHYQQVRDDYHAERIQDNNW